MSNRIPVFTDDAYKRFNNDDVPFVALMLLSVVALVVFGIGVLLAVLLSPIYALGSKLRKPRAQHPLFG